MTVPPYAYFVHRIGGSVIQVDTLVPENVNPHLYEPKPKVIQEIAQSQLWFRLGDPSDQKIFYVLKEQNPDLIVVDLAQGIDLLSVCKEETLSNEPHHCHGEGADFHIWLSPRLAMKQAETIAHGLMEAFPELRDPIRNQLQSFLLELDQLDQEIAQMLAPKKGEAILVSHPAFGYFCRDYHLTQLSIEMEGKDPLPQHITYLLNQAEQFPLTIVLLQPQYSNKGAELIAQKLKLPTAMVNPYAEDYLDNLRQIAHIIATGDSSHASADHHH